MPMPAGEIERLIKAALPDANGLPRLGLAPAADALHGQQRSRGLAVRGRGVQQLGD